MMVVLREMGQVPARLTATLLALVLACLMPSAVHGQTFTADWTNLNVGSIQGVPSGSSVTAGPRTITITHSQITNGGPFTNFYGTEMLNYWNGTLGSQTGSLLYSMDNDTFDPNDRFRSIYTFDGPVTNLQFAVAHVDRATSPMHDGVTIEYRNGTGAWLNIRSNPTTYTLGPVVGTTTLSGVQGFHGLSQAGATTSTTGNIAVNLGVAPVTQVRITYHFGQNQPGDPAGNVQYIGLSDFTFEVAGVSVSDMSLAKTVSNASPASGNVISYTLSLTNSTVSLPDSNVRVRDLLPTGVSFNSASGYGTYNASTGIWTVPAIAPGQTRSITLNVTVTAPNGVSITNYAEVISQTNFDTDSTPGNDSSTEDDDDTAVFTVTGTRTAGTAPSLSATCSPANQIIFDWDTNAWPAGSLSNTCNIPGIGNMDINLSLNGGTWVSDPTFGGQSPALANANNGGFAGTQLSLHQYIDFLNRSSTSTMEIDLPTAVPGVQFTIFDVDFAANDFADEVTVTGSFNGATVIPTLTNGTANYVVGNTAVGDASSGGTAGAGNVVVTFQSPVDTITIVYGNAATAPANPDGQAAAWFDISFCRPVASLNVTKISNVVSDGVSGTNPKAIPGATVRYCILVSNPGSATVTDISAQDNLPAGTTFIPGSMLTSTSCSGATTAEDDNAVGGDESDPFGMSFAAGSVTGTASALAPAGTMAMIFTVTVD